MKRNQDDARSNLTIARVMQWHRVMGGGGQLPCSVKMGSFCHFLVILAESAGGGLSLLTRYRRH